MADGLWDGFRGALRQALQPREFRIAPAALPADWLALLERRLQPPPPAAAPAPAPAGDERSRDREQLRLLADLATGLWRLKPRLLEPGTDRPREGMKRAWRDVEALGDLLAGAGVRVIDHTGHDYDPGQVLEVAARVPVPGLRRDRVQETVRPTVYIGDRHVQVGQVLVEVPADG